MSVLIGHASIAENGGINGAPGDQTDKEVCTRSWYNHGWNVMLICNDKALAARAADEMRKACANNKIGYGQYGIWNRTTAYESAKANGGTFANASGNTDCSQLVSGCYIFAGLSGLSPNCTTRNLRQALLNTGKFTAYTDAAHINSDAYAEVGAIYLKEGSHVVMALENKNGGTVTPPDSSETYTVQKGDTLSEIAATYGTTVADLAALNGISDPNMIIVGQVLKVVGSAPVPTPDPTPSGDYVVGREYTLRSNMSVRTGPGTSYRRKTHSELTPDGRNHDKNKNGCLDSGTVVTCQEVRQNGSQIWIKVPSGWMCARDGNTVYIS